MWADVILDQFQYCFWNMLLAETGAPLAQSVCSWSPFYFIYSEQKWAVSLLRLRLLFSVLVKLQQHHPPKDRPNRLCGCWTQNDEESQQSSIRLELSRARRSSSIVEKVSFDGIWWEEILKIYIYIYIYIYWSWSRENIWNSTFLVTEICGWFIQRPPCLCGHCYNRPPCLKFSIR